MSDIYTCVDLGTDSVKVVVCRRMDDKYHVLASSSVASRGIKNGYITDTRLATSSVSNALKAVNEMLGFKVEKVIATVPPKDCLMNIVHGSVSIIDYNEITSLDISNVLSDAIKGYDFKDQELVTAMPISFTIDEERSVSDPKGLKGSILEARVVISTMPKAELYRILEVLKLSGVETVDITFTSFGDYYTIRNREYDEEVGAIINIGEESTNVSVFNKGIQIKNSLIPVGSRNVDKDLTYVFKTKLSESRKIKEDFAISLESEADANDIYEAEIDKNNTREINQVGASKVVESRVRELLKLAKNEIKNLTNREIRYIIITGGLSELSGFQYLVEQEFGFVAKVCNMKTMGIRHNKYSSAYGGIKYFNAKLDLRGKHYNMVTSEDEEKLTSVGSSLVGNENIISKVFGHFFDN